MDTSEKRYQKLDNFCSIYSQRESDELLSWVLVTVIGGNYAEQSDSNKRRILDFMEALEELLPEVYKLNEQQGNEDDEKRDGKDL